MLKQSVVLPGRVRAQERNLIRASTRFSLPLAALLVAVILIPGSGWATTVKNCPVEPAQGVPIKSGDTYFGSNCVLNTASDLDSFAFNAKEGDSWLFVASGPSIAYPDNLCLELLDPTGNTVFQACSDTYHGVQYVLGVAQLKATGDYTLDLTETTNTTTSYGLSLERVSPAPPDGVALALGKVIDETFLAPSAQNAFTFYADTSGKYQASASMTSGGYPANLCIWVFAPDGSAAVGQTCTDTYHGVYNVQADFTPTQNGTYVLVTDDAPEIDTYNYNVSVSCLSGQCITKLKCELTDSPTYSSGTLTMNFEVGTPVAVTWNGWLTVGNTMTSLFSQALPITEPPTKQQVTQALSPSGVVGILSTFTTKKNGITCSNWATINTGSARSESATAPVSHPRIGR